MQDGVRWQSARNSRWRRRHKAPVHAFSVYAGTLYFKVLVAIKTSDVALAQAITNWIADRLFRT